MRYTRFHESKIRGRGRGAIQMNSTYRVALIKRDGAVTKIELNFESSSLRVIAEALESEFIVNPYELQTTDSQPGGTRGSVCLGDFFKITGFVMGVLTALFVSLALDIVITTLSKTSERSNKLSGTGSRGLSLRPLRGPDEAEAYGFKKQRL